MGECLLITKVVSMELASEEIMKEVEESREGIKDREHFVSFP